MTIPATAPGTRTTSPPGPACCRTCCARRAGRDPSRRCPPSGAACGSRWTRRALPPVRRTCGWRCWARRVRSWRSLPSGWRCWTRPCRPRPCCRPSGSTPTALRTTTMCRCSARSTGAFWTISWPAPPTTASTCCSRRCSPRRWTPPRAASAPPCSWWTWPLRMAGGASALTSCAAGYRWPAATASPKSRWPTCSPSGGRSSPPR